MMFFEKVDVAKRFQVENIQLVGGFKYFYFHPEPWGNVPI